MQRNKVRERIDIVKKRVTNMRQEADTIEASAKKLLQG